MLTTCSTPENTVESMLEACRSPKIKPAVHSPGDIGVSKGIMIYYEFPKTRQDPIDAKIGQINSWKSFHQ